MTHLNVMPKKTKEYKVAKCPNKYEADSIKETLRGNQVMLDNIRFIRDILHREGCENSDFGNQKALDLDSVEAYLAIKEKRNRNNTVDFVVGLSHKFTLLVEAKLRAKSPRNFYRDIDDKIKYSRSMLISQQGFCHFDSNMVVLLKDEKFEQNKRMLKTLTNNKPYLCPLRVMDFYNMYFV